MRKREKEKESDKCGGFEVEKAEERKKQGNNSPPFSIFIVGRSVKRGYRKFKLINISSVSR